MKGIEPSSLSPVLVPLIIRGFHMGEQPATRRLLLLLLLLLIDLNQVGTVQHSLVGGCYTRRWAYPVHASEIVQEPQRVRQAQDEGGGVAPSSAQDRARL